MTARCFIVFLSMLFCVSAFCAPNSKTELKRINTKIASIKATITQEQSTRQNLQSELAKVEVSVGKTQTKLNITNKHLKKQQAVLSVLQKKFQDNQAQLQSDQALLSKQIRMAYILGRQPYLKLLLSQQETSKLSRLLTYYQYITRNQIDTIKQLQTTIKAIETNRAQIHQHYQTLQRLKVTQLREHNRLQKTLQNRKQLITRINKNIQTKSQKLNALLQNKQRLDRTMTHLERVVESTAVQKQNFAAFKNQLPWPTRGRLMAQYGTPIQHSELKWSGVLIRARNNQPVRAIAYGKVIFAKWMSGYGLLMIISHGHGYMSLYGRNHVLNKRAGDFVKPGEIISTVGQSGGHNKPALYFAIWHNGKPVNPSTFCSSRRRFN